jgi:hypothetical protein
MVASVTIRAETKLAPFGTLQVSRLEPFQLLCVECHGGSMKVDQYPDPRVCRGLQMLIDTFAMLKRPRAREKAIWPNRDARGRDDARCAPPATQS